jgi:polysaccharide export outer membrane protein
VKLQKLFIFTLTICLILTQIVPIFAEEEAVAARISPFVKYEETGTYKLSRYDVLNIVIIGYPNAEHFSNIRVGIDGDVNLPFVGTLKLGGLTIDEAHTLLTQKLGEYLKDPNLSIMVSQYGARQIYVMGEVNRQGIYELPITSMNIFSAITSAGGITRRGRPKHIAVVRMVGSELTMREVNLDAFVKKQDVEQNIALLDGDMVYVPKSNKIILSEDIMPLVGMYGIYKTIIRD